LNAQDGPVERPGVAPADPPSTGSRLRSGCFAKLEGVRQPSLTMLDFSKDSDGFHITALETLYEVKMIGDMRLPKALWAGTAVLAFLAALAGVLSRDIYIGLFPPDFLPGAFPQDVLTILVSIFLIVLAAITKGSDVKRQIVAVGLLGSLFYLYGIFTIERVYNSFYLVYAAVFALAFWSIVISLTGFTSQTFANLSLSEWILRTSAISSILIAAVFTFLWVTALIPLMRGHNRIEYLYSIYILDLCFVMPAFVITALLSFRRNPLGILMTPAMMILGFFVIFPLGLNELAKPSAGMALSLGPLIVSFAFAFSMLATGVLQLARIRLG
jgi:hypothetical protein